MTPSTALQEEYRRCLERDFRRGHTGVCNDSSLKELLWCHLLEDPELHCALQGDDTFAMLATALRGQLDLGVTLQNLCKAFEVLELAAINLYFFPWRKEFTTIKTFSGVYVHVLQGILSDADLARSFRRLGYIQKDDLHLVISQPPSGANLLWAACGFFAARVECEILGKIVEELEPCGVSSEELLQARREMKGSLEGCVAKLQSLVRWPRGRELRVEPADGVDLYRETQEAQSPYREPSGARVPSPHQLPLCERSSPRLQSREQQLHSPQGLTENRGTIWASGQEQPYGNGILGLEGPDPETSFSFISLRRELSRTTDTDSLTQPGSWLLCPSPHYDSPSSQSHGASGPASPAARQPRSPQLSPAGLRRSPGLAAGMATAEPPRYHLHLCLRPGALPSSCCNTCRLLHSSSCDVAQLCRGSHRMEELQSEKQQRLWLQRTEMDKLLHEGGGAWQ
ncbi:spermatogenesis-associated protein 2-like protein [Tiliqua scincoides]|uniref:spermatogenesis-associated protein 2-like protein n=1 Tax=Tiliqua scincoides TaxID=71010 RepID=UPI003461C229